MKKTDLPTRRPVPFGANGPRRNLTDDTPTGSNQASYDKGFPPVTMTIRAAGGLPPDGRDMNQAFNELYTGLRWQNAGTGYPFDADFAAAIGGYPAGAKVPNSTNDGFWLNTTDDNANNPEVEDASVTGWVPAGNYGITTLTGLATGTVTLTTLQAAKEEIILSGNLTANITVIFPAWIKNWTVVNNCMGDFTLTCKTQSGTGVVVNSGRNAISCDGENMVFDIPAASLTKAGITQLSSATDSNSETMAATPKAVKAAYDLASATGVNTLYPVGIVTWFAQNKDPNTLFPGTTWTYIGEDKTIRLASADGSDVMTTGGSDTVTLTADNIPAHGHAFSGTTSEFDYGTKTTDEQGEHVHSYAAVRQASGDSTWIDSWAAQVPQGSTTYYVNASGKHVHNTNIGPHEHTVSGTTENTGSGTIINVTNSFVKLMAWYRSA